MYQLVGSIEDDVKKHAVVGSPIPSTFGVASKKLRGATAGITSPAIASCNSSSRSLLIVATRLLRRRSK